MINHWVPSLIEGEIMHHWVSATPPGKMRYVGLNHDFISNRDALWLMEADEDDYVEPGAIPASEHHVATVRIKANPWRSYAGAIKGYGGRT